MSLRHWHPSVIFGLGGVLTLYLIAIGLARRHPRPSGRQTFAFVAGTGLIATVLSGPIDELADSVSLSVHMTQHLLLTLVVPPLWLFGTPAWALRPLLRLRPVARAGFVLTRPLVALALASGVLIGWHMPVLYDAALEHETLHALEHLTLLGGALLAWWPVLGPLPEWPRPTPPVQILYLFLCMVPMTLIAAPITLAEDTLYRFYAHVVVPAWWPLSPLADQRLAGILMWTAGTFGYISATTVIFFHWASREGQEETEPRRETLLRGQ
jgi:putative membrane protein